MSIRRALKKLTAAASIFFVVSPLPAEALAETVTGATSLAAKSLHLDDEIDAIAPGRSADVIAVAGDPLTDIEDIHDVRFVMRGGVRYK